MWLGECLSLALAGQSFPTHPLFSPQLGPSERRLPGLSNARSPRRYQDERPDRLHPRHLPGLHQGHHTRQDGEGLSDVALVPSSHEANGVRTPTLYASIPFPTDPSLTFFSHEIDLTLHKDIGLHISKTKLVRYQANPLANWGPAPRARNKADDGAEVRPSILTRSERKGNHQSRKVRARREEEDNVVGISLRLVEGRR